MNDIWSVLLQTLTASGVAALLLALKAMFRDKLSPQWQFAAWGVLAMVLLRPAGWRGRYVLFNWPFYVELLRSALTGEYGALAHVTVPVPLPPLTAPRTAADLESARLSRCGGGRPAVGLHLRGVPACAGPAGGGGDGREGPAP